MAEATLSRRRCLQAAAIDDDLARRRPAHARDHGEHGARRLALAGEQTEFFAPPRGEGKWLKSARGRLIARHEVAKIEKPIGLVRERGHRRNLRGI